MADNLTPKQEKFCQVYIETGNASEAYRQAYNTENMKPETINVAASQLLDNYKVSTRIAGLQAEHRERHNITVDSLTIELDEAREVCRGEKQGGGMTQATMGKAKIHGLITDNHKVDGDMEMKVTLEIVGVGSKNTDT